VGQDSVRHRGRGLSTTSTISATPLLFWGEALAALIYAIIALAALPRREPATAEPGAEQPAGSTGSYLAVLPDRRCALYLIATFCNAAVYIQYLSTLPLRVKAQGVPILADERT
jgi:hypothetical protein